MPSSTKPSALPPAARLSNSESPLRFNFVPLLIAAANIALLGVAAYYFWPRSDYKAELDRQIEESWMEGREVVDAVEFFEHGGAYESRPGKGTADIDRKYVLPLVKRLRDEHGLTVVVVKRDDVPNAAMAVMAQAPNDRAARNRVRTTILEAADAFPGFAMQNWSHRWVSLDFFDEVEIAAFPPKTLEKLRTSQRRME